MTWNEQNRRVLYGFRSKESKDAMEDLPLLYAVKIELAVFPPKFRFCDLHG